MTLSNMREKLGLSIVQFARLIHAKRIFILYGEENDEKNIQEKIKEISRKQDLKIENIQTPSEMIEIKPVSTIRELRLAIDGTLVGFAKAIGANRNSIYYYELKKHKPSVSTAKRIIDLADKNGIAHCLTVEKLISGEC